MNDEVLTIEEAASVLKVASSVIGNLLEAGEIPGKQIGGEWRTTTRALVSYVDGVPLQTMCCTPISAEGDSELALANVNACGPSGGCCC